MACLVMEVLMFLTGLYVFFRPNLQLTDRINLLGKRARIVGLIWIAPLPLAFFLGTVLTKAGIDPEQNSFLMCLEPLLVLGAFTTSLIYARMTDKRA
jgi:hypothetical protein